jgi:hypothetical protein
MQKEIEIRNGIKYQCPSGQHEHLVRQQKARSEYGLRVIDERLFYLRGLLAAFSSANNLLTATSTKSLREKYLFFDVAITLSIWSRIVWSLKFCECRRYCDLAIGHLFDGQFISVSGRNSFQRIIGFRFTGKGVFDFSRRLKNDFSLADLKSRVIALPIANIDSKHLLLLYCWFNIQVLINAASSLPSSVVSIRFKKDLRLSKQSLQPWYEYAPAFEPDATLNSDFAFTKSTSSFSKQRYDTASARLVSACLFSSIWFVFILCSFRLFVTYKMRKCYVNVKGNLYKATIIFICAENALKQAKREPVNRRWIYSFVA